MAVCDLLIKNAAVLRNFETLEENTDIVVADGVIQAVGKDIAGEWEPKETLDGNGKLFMPGLIDSHMHTG